MTTYKITGSDAVRLAQRDNLSLFCEENPIATAGPVGAHEAAQIARQDPDLVFVKVTPDGWWHGRRLSSVEGYNVGDYFTSSGMFLGPDDDGIEPTWNDAQ
jgi:hypothetical protein